MEFTQLDRDKIRASQHSINKKALIGNIIEHKCQDPRKYKQISLLAEQTKKDFAESLVVSETQYRSKYLNNEPVKVLNSIDESEEPDLPISAEDVHVNLWLNMDKVEFDKLEWLTSKTEKKHFDKMNISTLFDKEGKVVSIANVQDGSMPSDQCHSIEDIVNLLDSGYQPQKTYALKVVSKIATLATMGYYDGAFSENIHDILMKNCLLRARHLLDSPNESTCLAALNCIRFLLCNTQVDEVILDRIHPLMSEHFDTNMWLEGGEMKFSDFPIDMKDAECVELDAILTLVCRTDILKRFYYLVSNKMGNCYNNYCECILYILIRMARHSTRVCSLIMKQGLLRPLIEEFLPSSITIQKKNIRSLSIMALKLIRIITQAQLKFESDHLKSNENSDLQLPEDIVPVIQAYFFIDVYTLPPNQSEVLLKLHIETLRLMKVLCKSVRFRGGVSSVMALGRDKLFTSFRAMSSLSSTKVLDSTVSFDWQYAAHLIDLTGSFSIYEKSHSTISFTDALWSSYIKPIVLQWLVEVIRMKIVPHLDVSIAIASGVSHFTSSVDELGCKNLIEVIINSAANKHNENLSGDFFQMLAQSASENSPLLSFLEKSGKLRDPKGLPSYGFLNYNLSSEHKFKLNPIFDTDSPYILLNMFISQLQQRKVGTMENLRTFVDNIHLIRYTRSITCYYKLDTIYESSVQNSFIAQYEIQIIGKCLLLIGNYYLDYMVEMNDNFGALSPVCDLEPAQFTRSRFECNSNLCYYAISTVGLLSTNTPRGLNLKDQLFEKVLLNSTLQSRVSRENFEIKPTEQHQRYSHRDFIAGQRMFHQLTNEDLHVLVSVYTSCEQPNRFWIFQPILKYYFDKLNTPHEEKQDLKADWFERKINWRIHIGELASCSDYNIFDIILTFNSTMMLYSRFYSHLFVKPNVEDYLCIIGSLFLDDDLFLNETVSKALSNNFRFILNECIEKSGDEYNIPFKDASKIIKPLDLPLADFFTKLVDQFESVSYGNTTFSNFLLLFLTPMSDKLFRRTLFQEKSETCLSQIRIGFEELWAPREIFFGQREQDPEIKSLIKRSTPYILKASFLDYYRKFHSQA